MDRRHSFDSSQLRPRTLQTGPHQSFFPVSLTTPYQYQPRAQTPQPGTPPTPKGVVSKALRRPVFIEDSKTKASIEEILKDMRYDCSARSVHLTFDTPPLPDRLDEGTRRLEVDVSLDVQFIEDWLQRKLYTKTPNGELYNPKKVATFLDMEQCGNQVNTNTGKPATLQIGVPGDDEELEDFDVLIIQLCHLWEVPSTLTRFINDTPILKIGHGMDKDLELLFELGLRPASFLEINALSRIFLITTNNNWHYHREPRLSMLTELYLNFSTDKATLPPTAWSDTVLHPWKTRYACFDCWVVYAIYRNIVRRLIGHFDGDVEKAMEVISTEVRKQVLEFDFPQKE
ncbi:hypothetical protein HDV00_009245 [Rhizophlyctis rosea]|nr:hypothetical protein HDV00_009245 [Rhizophlyctis rosea]